MNYTYSDIEIVHGFVPAVFTHSQGRMFSHIGSVVLTQWVCCFHTGCAITQGIAAVTDNNQPSQSDGQ